MVVVVQPSEKTRAERAMTKKATESSIAMIAREESVFRFFGLLFIDNYYSKNVGGRPPTSDNARQN